MGSRIISKLNRLVHPLLVKRVMRAYYKKSKSVELKHPELFLPVDSNLSARHRALWGRVGLKCGDRWLRLHVNLTGIQDYTFCPEDIFFARIERILNDCGIGEYGAEEKNNLLYYLPNGYEPETLVRYIRGNFFDNNGNWLSREDANEILKSEDMVVGKPCRSSGGNGVKLYSNLTADWILQNGSESYVVQRRIVQDGFSASFNAASVNTVRMMTLRCPWSGEIVVCRSMMRMGISDEVVDNMMKGGLCVCVDKDGSLGRYAYDYDGKKFDEHPVSHRIFLGLRHPYYESMVDVAKKIHARIMAYNLLSFDLVPRQDGSICVVEINAISQGITQLQYDFGGLFGEHTEQLVNWCASNIKYDSFKHIRTWY